MSEEYEEVEELSAEEIFEQHQQEINERFEEKGFFQRVSEMFKGLSKPKSSREYKLAKLELARLQAPLVAIMLPVLGVIVLIVVTAVGGQTKETIQVDIARAEEQEEELKEEEEVEPEVEPETPPDEQVDVQIDTPTVGPVSEMTAPTPAPANEPVSVKPAQQDSVAFVKSPVTMKSMTGSRSPGMIGRMTCGGAGYGDKNTEAAVMKVLRWLKKNQAKDGSWGGTIANTALAILTYLAHGETPASKEFGPTVEAAIQHLIDAETDGPTGATFRGTDGNEYATLICTYALCEAYGMTKNPNVKEAAMKALTRIVRNQGPTGGYDYKINKASSRDDMSFEGWALQALKAGKMAGLHPEGLEECIKKAIRCLKTRNFRGGGFNYTAGGAPTGLTATGCLCMQLLGYGNQPEVASALEYMREWKPVFTATGAKGDTPGSAPQYYCYYAAQAKYQAGMKQGANGVDTKTWQDWNAAMKAIYPSSITTLPEKIEGPDGKMHAMGYYKQGYNNPVMGSCLVALQLMVYYRYLPTTQTKAGEVTAEADEAPAKSNSKKKAIDDVDVEVDI